MCLYGLGFFLFCILSVVLVLGLVWGVVFFFETEGKTDLLLSSFASAPKALNIMRKLVRNVSLSC